MDGLKFDGGTYLTLSSLTRYTFTLAFWVKIDSAFSNVRQEVLSSTGSVLTLEVEPWNDLLFLNAEIVVSASGMAGK